MNNRRFIWRWAGRVVRKEWRQHVVILALLATGVTVAIALAVTAFNTSAPETKTQGHAQVKISSSDPASLDQALTRGGHSYGSIQTVTVDRAGSTQDANMRVMDPDEYVTGPLIDLLEGKYPTSPNEVALTDRAFVDKPSIGTSLELDGVEVVVVGLVENPMTLSDEFVLAKTIDHYPSVEKSVTEFYIDDSQIAIDDSVRDLEGVGFTDTGTSGRQTVGLLANVVGAFGMLEVALLVGSAFAVIAKRRQRQFGLLAAAGAPPKAIRSAAMMSGLILGLIGAGVGLIAGLAVARALVVALESTLDHRITFEAPPGVVLPNVLLAIGVSAWAARRPAVKLSKQSVISVLSATRPQPEPVGPLAFVGVVAAGVGAVLLMAGFKSFNAVMAVGGVILTPVGLLLLSPLLVGLVGKISGSFPLEARLAGRAVSRYNRRSAAAVAAIALALSIPMGIAVVTESIDARKANVDPNLFDNTLAIWVDDIPGHRRDVMPVNPSQDALASAVEAAEHAAPGVRFTPINVALPENFLTDSMLEDGAVEVGIPVLALSPGIVDCSFCNTDSYGFEGGVEYQADLAWIATPELLEALGLETGWLSTDSPALIEAASHRIATSRSLLAGEGASTVATSWARASSVPPALLSPRFVEEGGFEVATLGWLGTSDSAITPEDKLAISDAINTKVDVEFHDPGEPQSRLRNLGLLIGLIVGIGITISAVSLLAAEQKRDIALLATLGAPPASGRRMAATISAVLALTGAAIAILIGYVPLLPMINSKGDNFPFVVPFQFLIGLLVLFPIMAAATGWLMNRQAAEGTSLQQLRT